MLAMLARQVSRIGRLGWLIDLDGYVNPIKEFEKVFSYIILLYVCCSISDSMKFE